MVAIFGLEMEKSKKVAVAFANQLPQYLDIETVKKWEPKNVNKFGSTVFFKVDDTYVSMSTEDYRKIFNI
jgi:hypothetical protein